MSALLESLFAELAATVPDDPPARKELVFTAETLPRADAEMGTEKLVVRKTHHDYASAFRADLLHVFAEKKTYRQLGCLILSTVFHPQPRRTTLTLTHKNSDISKIIIETSHPDPAQLPLGYSTRPLALRYRPGPTEKHPWAGAGIPKEHLPALLLSNERRCTVTSEDWEARDTVFGMGTDQGAVRLAQLLLDAGCPWNPVREYELETNAGIQGVAPMSAEVSLFLPGSEQWGYQGTAL